MNAPTRDREGWNRRTWWLVAVALCLPAWACTGCSEETKPAPPDPAADCGGVSGEVDPWTAAVEILVGEVVVVGGRRDTLPIAGATIRCMGHLASLEHPVETQTRTCDPFGLYQNSVETTQVKLSFDILSASATGFATEQYYGVGHTFCANDPASWSWGRTLTLQRQ